MNAVLQNLRQRGQAVKSWNDLTRLWRTFVLAIASGYPDSIYDYTNDLSVRDIIEEVPMNLSKDAAAKAWKTVAPIDEDFHATTRPVVTPVPGAPAFASSWWCRVPLKLSGELLHDLQIAGTIGARNDI